MLGAMTSSSTPSFVAELDAFLRGRLAEAPRGSYSYRLLTDPVLVQRKIMEEAFEVCLELGAPQPDASAVAEEAADLVFHLVAALVSAGVAWEDVEAVLRARHRHPARDSTYDTEESP